MSYAHLRASAQRAPNLERIVANLACGLYDDALLRGCDITRTDLNALREHFPPLFRAIENALGESLIEDGVLRRCIRYMGRPNDAGCTPWLGASSGKHSEDDTGTPVISIDGKMRSVRVALWNDRYPPGTPEHVGTSGKVRLRNVGCPLGRNCVTLSHWYKPGRGEIGGHDPLDLSTLKEPPESTLRRIWAQTEPAGLCVRWLGACAGVTPVFSYGGKTTIVRRVLWDLSYPERPLRPGERLQNEGCAFHAGCLQITHWRVAAAPIDRADAYVALLNNPVPEPRGKPCQSGKHWIRDDASYCAPCRQDQRNERARTSRMGYELGRAIRGRIRRSRERLAPSEYPGLDFDAIERDQRYQEIGATAIAEQAASEDRRNRRPHTPVSNSSVSEEK